MKPGLRDKWIPTTEDRERAIQRLRNAAERYRKARAEVASAEQEIEWAALALNQIETRLASGNEERSR